MKPELLALAAELQQQQRPFVVATVVWARSPSSGKPGSTALIEPDGTIHGWIGGACAEPAVVRQARDVLDGGEAQLMYLGPEEELGDHNRSGVVAVPISCSSEGALEVFMEPVIPLPRLIVIGHSPLVRTLSALATALGWSSTVVDDRGTGSGYEDDIEVVTSLDGMERLGIDGTTPIVVATQGHYDEPALEAALATDAPYIGLVASAKRGETVIGYLRDRGMADKQIERVVSPAGIDLGHVPHREIAVAILAQLVQLRPAWVGSKSRPVVAPKTAIDPVCGMTVEIEGARFTTEVDGETFYFCSPACNTASGVPQTG